ncbi:MAG TPA: hypothetical protein VGL20_21245 [Candidatus Dormibacteraeota bacterium]|jgi:hypothetical protein
MYDAFTPISVTRFCGASGCGCPELLVQPDAVAERRVVITDDFGQRIQMSPDQLRDLLEQARRGSLDGVLEAALQG